MQRPSGSLPSDVLHQLELALCMKVGSTALDEEDSHVASQFETAVEMPSAQASAVRLHMHEPFQLHTGQHSREALPAPQTQCHANSSILCRNLVSVFPCIRAALTPGQKHIKHALWVISGAQGLVLHVLVVSGWNEMCNGVLQS